MGRPDADSIGARALYDRIQNLPVPDPNDPTKDLEDPDRPGVFVRGYSWHHNEDLRTMELVPKILHQDANHQGGTSVASSARW